MGKDRISKDWMGKDRISKGRMSEDRISKGRINRRAVDKMGGSGIVEKDAAKMYGRTRKKRRAP